MNRLWKKLGLAAALTSSTMAITGTAQAHDDWSGGNDDAIIAIGAGLIGLAIGAAIADRDDHYYYDRRYYDSRRYVTVRGRPGYYYYYPGNPNRYYRDRYYTRYYQPYYRERHGKGYNRDYYRHDRSPHYAGKHGRHYDDRSRYDDKRWAKNGRDHRNERGWRSRH